MSWTVREEDSLAEIHGFSDHQPDETTVEIALTEAAKACGAALPEFDISRIANRNWVAENIKQFPPQTAGRFFVFGSEYNGPVPAGKLGLCIPAGIAFGSGDHGSTLGCLRAIDSLRDRAVNRALDMGCGSGILSVAIAKRWPATILAADFDPDAVMVTAANAARNGKTKSIRAIKATGYAHRTVISSSYDLIVSNILARPLMRMAADLAHHLLPGGTAILSGLLLKDGYQVLAAHRRQGLILHDRIVVDGWLTLVMKKNCRRAHLVSGKR